MRAISVVRHSVSKIFARMASQPVKIKQFYGQAKQTLSHTDIALLEARATAPLQVLDPGDANFGKFYYVAGYDSLGDPNHPIGP